jgi:non-specific serine/threonine protein kinase
LHSDLRLLSANARLVEPRHQTLSAAIDWSFALLGDAERILLRRLATFAGGFGLDAAEAICADNRLVEDAILDVLTALVDRSLVLAEQSSDGGVHYRLLEPVRQFAFDRLIEAREAVRYRARHADWFVQLAEQVPDAAGWFGPEEVAAFDRLEAEHDNLRSALRWHLDQGNGEAALRLAVATYRFWDRRGHHVEACRWFDRALAAAADAPIALRARALNAAAQARWVWGATTPARLRSDKPHWSHWSRASRRGTNAARRGR